MSNQPAVRHLPLPNPADHHTVDLFRFGIVAIEDPVLQDGKLPVLVGFAAAENIFELDLVVPLVLLGPAICTVASVLSFQVWPDSVAVYMHLLSSGTCVPFLMRWKVATVVSQIWSPL